MRKRAELQKLVFVIVKDKEMTAREIYEVIRHNQPSILSKEKVDSFKSFARLVPTFKNIQVEEKSPFVYKAL